MTMDTFIRRHYADTGRSEKRQHKQFPFWDYRSKRETTLNEGDEFMTEFLTTEAPSTTCTSDTESERSVCPSSSYSTDMELHNPLSRLSLGQEDQRSHLTDPYKLTLDVCTEGLQESDITCVYQPFFELIDHELKILNVTETAPFSDSGVSINGSVTSSPGTGISMTDSLEIPSLAVMFFLQEQEILGNERLVKANDLFQMSPWRFHHSEFVSCGRINPYPYNSQDFFYTSEDLPLWAVRQVHCGNEHIRFVRFVSNENWQDTINFYRLIIGHEPEALKPDFCSFLLCVKSHYNIQFALKKLPRHIRPRHTDSATLRFRISQVGSLVPLLPNVCLSLSDVMWETTDLDGNKVLFEVVNRICWENQLENKLWTPRNKKHTSRDRKLSHKSSKSFIVYDDHKQFQVNTKQRRHSVPALPDQQSEMNCDGNHTSSCENPVNSRTADVSSDSLLTGDCFDQEHESSVDSSQSVCKDVPRHCLNMPSPGNSEYIMADSASQTNSEVSVKKQTYVDTDVKRKGILRSRDKQHSYKENHNEKKQMYTDASTHHDAPVQSNARPQAAPNMSNVLAKGIYTKPPVPPKPKVGQKETTKADPKLGFYV